jgi:hypothetical protein
MLVRYVRLLAQIQKDENSVGVPKAAHGIILFDQFITTLSLKLQTNAVMHSALKLN